MIVERMETAADITPARALGIVFRKLHSIVIHSRRKTLISAHARLTFFNQPSPKYGQ